MRTQDMVSPRCPEVVFENYDWDMHREFLRALIVHLGGDPCHIRAEGCPWDLGDNVGKHYADLRPAIQNWLSAQTEGDVGPLAYSFVYHFNCDPDWAQAVIENGTTGNLAFAAKCLAKFDWDNPKRREWANGIAEREGRRR